MGYPFRLFHYTGYVLIYWILRGEAVAEKKLSRKELLNEPDEFISTTGQVINFAKDNPRMLIGIVVGFVLALVIGLGYYAHQSRKEARSHELFQLALRTYEKEIAGVNQPGKQELDRLLAEFDLISRDYSGFINGDLALLYCGHILYKAGDYSSALDRYTKTQSTSLAKLGFGPLIQYNLAQTLFASKNYDKAITLFEQFSRDTTSPYRREAHVNIARIYESMGKTKEAVQAYKQYLKIFPEAPDADFVKARIAQLSTPV